MQSTTYLCEIKEKILNHLNWLMDHRHGERADFGYAEMSGVRLPRIKLSRANFVAADLRGADLSGADLREACLYCVDLEGANLEGADLRGADLRGACLNDARLARADLTGADLSSKKVGADHPFAKISRYSRQTGRHYNDTSMVDVDLSQAQLTSAQLVGCDLSGAVLDGAAIGGANFSQATLVGASLEDMDFNEDSPFFVDALLDVETKSLLEDMRIDVGDRDFEPITAEQLLAKVDAHEQWMKSKGEAGKRLQLDLMRIPKVDLKGRNLACAALRRCLLTEVDLSDADMTLANLSFSDLNGVLFQNANLSGADLRKASIDGADFTGAVLNCARIDKVAEMHPTNMTKIRGGKAMLKVAEADQTIVYGADLREALMNLAFLSGANLKGARLPEKVEQRAAHVATTSFERAPMMEDTERKWG